MKETRLWYCNIWDKTIKNKNQSKHNKSKSHRHKKISIVVKEYEFIRPDINNIASIIKNCARNCYNIYLHTFKIKFICDINTTNGDFANGIISEKNKWKSKQSVRENGFIHKLTLKIHTNL